MLAEESHFIKHVPCEACGSSDAKAIYSNGTAYCFSCETWFPGDGSIPQRGRQAPETMGELLDNLKYSRLKSRGINEETCRKYSYTYGKYKGQIVQVAPYRNPSGELVAQHLRTRDKQFRWVGNARKLQLFGQDLWKPGKRLVITEGEIDCLTIAQVFNLKWPVVSVPNGAQSAKKYIKQNIEWIEGFQEVVFAFDSDADGQKAAGECAMLLTPGKAKVANFHPYKDANDMLKDGKSGDIATAIFAAKEYRPDGIVAGSDLSIEYLRADEDVEGYDLQFEKLNDMLRKLRKRELTTLTAGTGAGKSTLAREIAFHLIDAHGCTIGHIALEESVKKSALGFMALDLNVPMGDLFMDKSIVTPEDFERSYNKVIASDKIYFYDHFGSLEAEGLLSKIKYLAIGLNVDFIVLDHISIVVSGMEGGDERRAIDNLMTNLRSITENTGVGMLVITHLRVPQGEKKAHEEGGRVTLNQLRGSGSIKQLSDNIIAIERNQQAEDPHVANIRLLKNRLFGTTGLADTVRYNLVTGRLQVYEDVTNEEDENFDFIEDNNSNIKEENYDDEPF